MDLLERREPLAQLAALWQEVKDGEGRVALVAGEAGIGKTSLIRELTRTLDGRILLGACDAMATPRPLGPLVDVAPELSSELATMVASNARSDLLFSAVLRELAASKRPVLLVIEDAHWADAATLDLIRYLTRRIDRARALIAITYRDDEVGTRHPLRVALGDLATSGAIRRVRLERLSANAVRELARGSALDPHDLYRRSGGNPFFVTEAVASNTAAVPATVRDAVLARLARLDADARETIEAIAVLGARVRPELLDRLLGVRCTLEACVDVGLIQPAAIAFRHELGREAVLSTVAADRLRAWHQRALAVLVDDPRARREELAAIVHHAEAAGDADAVCEYGLAAARQAAGLRSHREASAHYARVARFFPIADSRAHAELLEAWAYECYLTGEQAASCDLRLRVAEMWHRLGDELRYGDNLRWLSRVSWFAGRRLDADHFGERAIAVLEPLAEGRELAAAFSNKAQLAMLTGDSEGAIAWGTRAATLARQLGDIELESHALNNMGTAKLAIGRLEGADELARSLALAKQAHHEEHIARAYTNLCSGLVMGRDARARATLDEGIAYCDEHDLDAWRLYMLGWRALRELHAGELAAAVETGLYTLTRATSPPGRIQPLVALGRVRARRGDPEVWAVLDEALAIALPFGELARTGLVRVARAEAAWIAGELDRVREEVAAILPRALELHDPWLAGELAWWGVLAGESIETPAWLTSPFVGLLRGDPAAAAATLRTLGCPFEHALGTAAIGTEAALREAFDELDSLGMTAAAAAITRQLRTLGVRSIPRGRRSSTRANQAGLTRREIEVLDLLVEGLRNSEIAKRLFISAKTVDHHVSAILGKLDLADRGEAARWWVAAKPRHPEPPE